MKTRYRLMELPAVLNIATLASAETGVRNVLTSRYYDVLLLLGTLSAAAVFLLREAEKSKKTLEIVGVYHKKDEGRVELVVKNNAESSYDVKPAIRLVRPTDDQPVEGEGAEIEMLPAGAGSAKNYELLCGDDSVKTIEPNSVETFSYDLSPEFSDKLGGQDKVNVGIMHANDDGGFVNALDEDMVLTVRKTHDYLKPVNDDKKFILKSDHDVVHAEVGSLEHLVKELKKAPKKAVDFHMRTKNTNDFAEWIDNAIGDEILAESLRDLPFNDQVTKKGVVDLIECRIGELRNN